MAPHENTLMGADSYSVSLCQPHSSAWVVRRLAARLFLDFDQNARGSLHLVNALLRLLEEALVEEQAPANLGQLWRRLVVEKERIQTTDVLVRSLLLHHFLELFEGLFVARGDLLGDLGRLEIVHLGLQFAVVFFDFRENFLAGLLSVRVVLRESYITGLVAVAID